MSSTETAKKRANCDADFSTSSYARSSGFCVATPTGQLLLLHMRAATHPIACMAELDNAMPSAPMQSAFAKSVGTRSPPVMMSGDRGREGILDHSTETCRDSGLRPGMNARRSNTGW